MTLVAKLLESCERTLEFEVSGSFPGEQREELTDLIYGLPPTWYACELQSLKLSVGSVKRIAETLECEHGAVCKGRVG